MTADGRWWWVVLVCSGLGLERWAGVGLSVLGLGALSLYEY